jgi:hypothetical protein
VRAVGGGSLARIPLCFVVLTLIVGSNEATISSCLWLPQGLVGLAVLVHDVLGHLPLRVHQ